MNDTKIFAGTAPGSVTEEMDLDLLWQKHAVWNPKDGAYMLRSGFRNVANEILAMRPLEPASPQWVSVEERLPEYPAVFHQDGGTMVSVRVPSNNKPSTGWIQNTDYDTLRALCSALMRERDGLRSAAKGVIAWADGIATYQDALLGRGYEKACDNWDMATTNLPPLDLAPLRAALKDAGGKG